jgi:NADH-quinone oxidoreductase subunit N
MSQLGAAININIITPELTLLVFSFIILVFLPLVRGRSLAPVFSFAAVLVSFFFVVKSWNQGESGYFDMVLCDNFCLFCKIIFLLTCGTAVLLSHDYLVRRNLARSEYYALMLISTAGMMVMVSSTSLIVIFLGLEAMSIPLYVLAGFNRANLKSNESAIKYFFMGAFASAFFIYGIALVFGGTGTTDLRQISISTGVAMQKSQLYFLVGAAMILIGFGFKIGSFPFHMWVPDVYEGAPTPVTAFFSIGPKAAGVAVLLRILLIGLGGVFSIFAPLLWMLAFFTMTIGNILAVMQNDVKRMLAYSSIAHAGYLLVALTAGGSEAVSAALFYLLAYGFFNMGAFTIVTIVENRKGGSNHIDTYKGLAIKHPWLSIFMGLFMFSLAGFPPTAGFIGKFYIFAAAVKVGLVWLVVAAVLNSLISVYYYLRPLKAAFFGREESADAVDTGYPLAWAVGLVIVITAAGAVGLGIFPGYFLKLAASSVFMMM